MRTLRTALTAAAIVLICAGYAGSQVAYFSGSFADYAARVDSPPVQRIAGFLLLAAIILAFVRDRDKSDQLEINHLPFTIYHLLRLK